MEDSFQFLFALTLLFIQTAKKHIAFLDQSHSNAQTTAAGLMAGATLTCVCACLLTFLSHGIELVVDFVRFFLFVYFVFVF